MFLEYTPEQQALRKELREYFAQLLTPDVRAALGEPGEGSPLFRDVVRQIETEVSVARSGPERRSRS